MAWVGTRRAAEQAQVRAPVGEVLLVALGAVRVTGVGGDDLADLALRRNPRREIAVKRGRNAAAAAAAAATATAAVAAAVATIAAATAASATAATAAASVAYGGGVVGCRINIYRDWSLPRHATLCNEEEQGTQRNARDDESWVVRAAVAYSVRSQGTPPPPT